ncbi:MAG: polyprenyl synthetase family protein [Clostridiales bacterium]|nr:polyprenyl synthetase family protein [Clostridiales bacterium]MBR6484432.1 polyprenyl synthetase family protein [Clostridiales bacterium]
MTDTKDMIAEVCSWIEPDLQKVFPDELSDDITVRASLYSLLAGGKRIRPCFMYQSARMLGMDPDEIKIYAVALEMIHTYSLIHDDLPSMDNDDLRRGMPTCHKKFSEGIAVLAGDNLLNRAYELLFSAKDHKAGAYIAGLAGINGMIGGQSIDIDSEDKKISLERLYELQRKKTGALLEAAICTPCIVAGCPDDIFETMKQISLHIGLAFQIKDDILDVLSNEEELGKSTGKDERDNKQTFVTMLGLEGAKERLDEEISGAYDKISYLKEKGYDTEGFAALTRFMAERTF